MIRRRTEPSQNDAGIVDFDHIDASLGDILRGERATLGKSLLDVQRELRLRASYIAAIENGDLSQFEAHGFISGYVKSYARYLKLDPDQVFDRFCRETGLKVISKNAPASPRMATGKEPLANPNALFIPRAESWFHHIHPKAFGSLIVLIALIAALGYGGWSVLHEIQRVQLAPSDDMPEVAVNIDPLPQPAAPPDQAGSSGSDLAHDPVLSADSSLAAGLQSPVLVPRDGPIAAINPEITMAAPPVSVAQNAPVGPMPVQGDVSLNTQVADQAISNQLEILAVRPAWVRVSTADGTVIFEKILNMGERYIVPAGESAALLRSGNSGSVYFVINGKTYGPAAPGPQVVKNVPLTADALTQRYGLANPSDDADLARIADLAPAVPEATP